MAFEKGHITWNKNIPMSEESKQKISNSKKGSIPWNKGLTKEEYKSHYKNGMGGTFEKGHTPHNKGIKGWMQGHPGYTKGMKFSEEHNQKISKALSGRKLSEQHKLNMSLSRRGEKCCAWKGGVTSLDKQIRKSFQYRQWRDDVFTRDDYTCQECGKKGFVLNAHHIKPFSIILQYYEITTLEEALECDELFNINNGITLCEECHRNIHNELNIRS
jgi:5-methylcytosine-specific restriction endonuclease McrA